MNREILFRGKSISTRNWTYGFFLGPDSIFSEYYDQLTGSWDVDEVSIDPSTLGQYTGFTDKKNTRIFEGDTLDNGYAVQMEDGRWLARKGISVIEAEWFFNWEITGTIHDNPELL